MSRKEKKIASLLKSHFKNYLFISIKRELFEVGKCVDTSEIAFNILRIHKT